VIEIVGHKRQKELLSIMMETGTIPHAVLFEGSSKLGKRSLALGFVQQLFCKDNCGGCWSCLNVIKGTHPDLKVISSSREIQIEQIRGLISDFSLKPYMAPFKVAIIDDAHLMNVESQNSILKLLEEPRGDTLIILITEYPEMLLETVRSRVERVSFSPVDDREIKLFLEKKGCKEIDKIVSFSFGKPGIAIDFMNNPSMISERVERVKELLTITSTKSPFRERFNYAKELADNSPEETLKIWLDYFRAIMIKKAKEEIKTNIPFSQIKKSLDLIEESIYLISKTNTNNRIILERLMLEI